MKKSVFTLLIACLFISATAQTNPTEASSENIFEVSEYNFGTIKQSKNPAVHEFEYVNTSDRPLIINSVKASCGCTVSEYSKEPLLPGKKSFVKVSYNTVNRPGAFKKNINVSTSHGDKTLVIKGNVE